MTMENDANEPQIRDIPKATLRGTSPELTGGQGFTFEDAVIF